jgi:hypothetical protein
VEVFHLHTPDLNGDSTRLGKSDGIAEQVQNDPHECLLLDFDEDLALRDLRIERELFGLHLPAEEVSAFVHDLLEVRITLLHPEDAVDDVLVVEQVLDLMGLHDEAPLRILKVGQGSRVTFLLDHQ